MFYNKSITTLVLVFVSSFIFSQGKLSKSITKEFSVTTGSELFVNNKYGNITIEGWKKNSISIVATIDVFHKKREEGQSLLDRINPEFNSTSNFVSVTTQVNKKSTSLISKYFKKVNPFDFNKGNINVDYKIFVPKSTKIDITQKFGDLILSNWSESLKAKVEHGDIWANDEIKDANISLRFGKLNANLIHVGILKTKNSDVDIEQANNLIIESSGTNFEFKTIDYLKLNSSKDKFYINNLNTLDGTLKYSELNLKKLLKKINTSLKIAEFKVSEIETSSPIILLNQESSRVDINVSSTQFKLDAKLEQGLLRIPKSFRNITTKIIDKKSRIRMIHATYNNQNNTGVVSITGLKGIIIFSE